jgi:hypothetical protein
MTAVGFVSPATPCLEAVYAAPATLPSRLASDAVLMIAPLFSSPLLLVSPAYDFLAPRAIMALKDTRR